MSLFQELKRRNVFRLAIAYLASAWVLVQIADLLIPIYGMSDDALRTITNLLAVGFIPALLLTWFFQFTPEGLKRDSKLDAAARLAPRSASTLDKIFLLVLVVAVGFFALDKFVLDPARDKVKIEEAEEQARSDALIGSYGEKSIAVMAFVNLSSDPEQEYFSDGIAEEMLNLLAKIPELRVISRSSAFSLKGQNLSMPEIAERLNVAHILEGSVRKAGNQIRITAQLIDGRTDTHLWSDTYDRPLDDIFGIQDEVAAKVVRELRVTLIGEMPKAIPMDIRAYALYLEARQITTVVRREEYPKALELLDQALAIEPEYIEAMIQQVMIYTGFANIAENDAQYQEAMRQKDDALQRALAVDPDNPAAKSFLAWQELFDDNLVTAARLAEEAADVDPYNSAVLLIVGVIATDLRRYDLAIRVLEYNAARDPLDYWTHVNLAWAYFESRRFDDALRHYELARSVAPGLAWQSDLKIGLVKLAAGDAAGALETFELNRELVEKDPGYRALGIAMASHDLGRHRESEAALQELLDIEGAEWPVGLARAYAWIGDPDEAFRYLRLAAEQDVAQLDGSANNPLFERLHDDPRWLPFLESIAGSTEQIAAIEFNPRLPNDLSAEKKK